jgi:hypothetical protein
MAKILAYIKPFITHHHLHTECIFRCIEQIADSVAANRRMDCTVRRRQNVPFRTALPVSSALFSSRQMRE